ncbi:right-handed parallel beta-helix repeat-containing protein [Halegenticoccus soli]|uniref:right-handed parallel beta-helix repeat-containing protein n=1 Tax=Halegenticoccus soli TaxID=1985678 RepID=UPI00117A7ECF|nr:right-handed parallel beta-helix repeat-containing protein [Halegenticoccus soli]
MRGKILRGADNSLVDEDLGTDWSRREFLGVLGLSTLPVPTSNTGTASEIHPQVGAQQADVSGSRFVYGPDKMNIGGRLIVGDPNGYNTIQEAISDAEDGDTIFVHGSYDAQTAGETFPIKLDLTQKKISLTGGHTGGSEIDASGVDANVLEVLGTGQRDYRNRALVDDLTITGGNIGLRLRGVPYSTYRGLIFYQNQSHGVEIEGYTTPEGEFRGTFGVNFIDCLAWGCRGIGFHLNPSARPHSTTFFGSHALYCGVSEENNLPGVQLRGFSSSFHGGTIQNNGAAGIDARSGAAQGIYNTYFEGNGMASPAPEEIFVGETSPDFAVRDCYFNGTLPSDTPNGRGEGYRGISIANAPNVTVQNSVYQNYEDAFVYVSNARDVDLCWSTHLGLDDSQFVNAAPSVLRLRDNGYVAPTDLRGISGLYDGDKGIHDGSGDYPFALAVWNGSNWISQIDGSVIQ